MNYERVSKLNAGAHLLTWKKNLAQARCKELAKWHEEKIQERETSRRCFYIPWTEAKINPVLGNAPKTYALRYYQLKVGHGGVGTYLTRIVSKVGGRTLEFILR